MATIRYFIEEIDFLIPSPQKTRQWLKRVITGAGAHLGELNYIFTTDEYLLKINLEYLSHDTYTDIITFDNAEVEGEITGDIYISIERVRENATEIGIDFETELRRVMVHGVLHLLGYDDESDEQEATMRQQEDAHLALWQG